MAAALLTLTGLSILGIGASFALAFGAFPGEAASHVLLGVFATLLNLLAHSFMMFYLIGKGKAVREAGVEAGLDETYYRRVARLRAPVFSQATVAMTAIMAAAIIGASVDVGVLPSWPHALLAGGGVLLQLRALLTEITALTGIGRIVDEVNRAILDS